MLEPWGWASVWTVFKNSQKINNSKIENNASNKLLEFQIS